MITLYVILGLFVFILFIAFYVWNSYNFMVKLKNIIKNALADIDVQLKLRFDLIPNLVETVKWYASHEKETLENVIKARTQFLDSNSAEDKIESDNMLTWALKSLFAVSESYPDLKANQSFLQIQTELSDIENKIAAARRFLNKSTQEYNTYIEMFPTNIIAWIFNFKEEKMFEIKNENERENVKVSFDK